MTEARPSSDTSFVVGLHDPAAAGAEVVGTKAATLARLTSAGFTVPEGFVVTTAACDRIRAAAGMPEDVWPQVLLHMDTLGPGPVAVRSSGCAEDLAGASYAGQYETVLGVEGAGALADAIGRCLSSATSERVQAYRGSGEPAPMAVLVQRMVPADAAGVAFTANPVTGDAEILVSAVKGLGERLVSGEADPDEWVLRGGEVSCLRSPEGALDEEHVRAIAQVAAEVERLFGSPQDIEWAVADGRPHLLQARPITALPVAPHIEVPTNGFWQKDTSHWPVPLTPFGASIYMPALHDVMRPMIEDFGLMTDGVEQRSLAGEVYTHVIPLGGKDRRPPPKWAMWLGARLAPPIRRRARAAQAALSSGLPERLLDRWENEWRAAFAAEFQELRTVDLATLDDAALLEHLDRAKEMLFRGADVHFRLVAPYYLALYEICSVCAELLGWDSIQSLSLLTGASQASSEAGRALADLAARVAADPAALDAVVAPGGDQRERLRRSAPWAADALDDYLEQFGHRTLNYDPGEPTVFERPGMVEDLLAEQVRARVSGEGLSRDPQDAVARARGELAGRSEEDKARFERVLASARRAYGCREDNIFWLDNQPSALLRYCAVEIGARLAGRGVIAHAGDAVFLEEPELRAALSHTGGGHLHDLVARRKAERAWVTAHPGPASYGEPHPPPGPDALSALQPALRLVNASVMHSVQLMFSPEAEQDGSDRLRGVPGSPGRFTGTARVVRDETEFAKLGPGDVLVAPVTSPPWSVLFLRAGAVITDGGGVLSHTAVIAREYGIPAVLATGDGTRRLHDGDVVEVDGTTGTVSILSASVATVT